MKFSTSYHKDKPASTAVDKTQRSSKCFLRLRADNTRDPSKIPTVISLIALGKKPKKTWPSAYGTG